MLRKTIRESFPAIEPRNLRTHVGLWIDKMLVDEVPSSAVAGPHLRKIDSAPIPDGYELAYRARRTALEAMAERGESLVFEAKASSRLVVGLGAKGVLEMGLTLDHTWGTPYIPGSALKGLCAAAAHQLTKDAKWHKPTKGWPEAAPEKGTEATDFQFLFGSTANAGIVTFHDAWWIPVGTTLPIHMDIMTVHHPNYYQSPSVGAKDAPSDFDEPVPVPFLSTSGTFLVALEGPDDWCKAAFQLLEAGLRELGIGAKTSSGYGRVTLTPVVFERQRQRAARIEALRVQFDRYEPGRKEAAVRALVGAIEGDVARGQIVEALSKVDKRHRGALVETARAALSESGRVLLDAVVTELAVPVVVRVEQQPVVLEKPREPAAPQSVRVRYEADKKAPKRFVLHIEGETKPLKSAVVDIDDELLGKLRATGEWVDVVVVRDGAKVKVRRGFDK